jgi:uncharacterized membrane protein
MSNIHPIFVHFPIALLTLSLVFEMLFLVRSELEFSRVGWWLHMAGTLGLLLSVATGLRAVSDVRLSLGAADIIEYHQQIALLVTGLFTGLLLWRIGVRTTLPQNGRAMYVAAFAAGLILMWLGAWYGGELVYRHGVGVMVP